MPSGPICDPASYRPYRRRSLNSAEDLLKNISIKAEPKGVRSQEQNGIDLAEALKKRFSGENRESVAVDADRLNPERSVLPAMSAQTLTRSLPKLASFSQRINRFHQRGESRAFQALGHNRQASELLVEVKARLRHGQSQAWVEAHCQLSYRIAAQYMDVHRRWDQIAPLLEPKVHRDAPLSLTGVLKVLGNLKPDATATRLAALESGRRPLTSIATRSSGDCSDQSPRSFRGMLFGFQSKTKARWG